MVRAKFTLSSYETHIGSRAVRDANGKVARDENGRERYEACEIRTLVFRPVYGNGDPNHENTKFWTATPSGELKLGMVSPEAWSKFELGKEYYLDFSLAGA